MPQTVRPELYDIKTAEMYDMKIDPLGLIVRTSKDKIFETMIYTSV